MSNAENLQRKIIEAIGEEPGLEGMIVKTNAEVEGRTAAYPVDLYLEFRADNGITYKIIIQTQHIDEELNKNQLFHFANVLQDISGQVMGVIFTRPVYDKLVKDVAKDVGIMLYEMRNAEDQPVWEPNISKVKIDVDKEWVKREREKHHLDDTPIQSGGHPKYMYLYDENDACIDTVEGVFNAYIQAQKEKGAFEPAAVRHDFKDRAVYLKTDHEIISKVKLNGISFEVQFRNVTALGGAEILNNILRTAFAAKLN